ncbi:unnamed protein product, partial [Symbiodinium sp. CCMP2592]
PKASPAWATAVRLLPRVRRRHFLWRAVSKHLAQATASGSPTTPAWHGMLGSTRRMRSEPTPPAAACSGPSRPQEALSSAPAAREAPCWNDASARAVLSPRRSARPTSAAQRQLGRRPCACKVTPTGCYRIPASRAALPVYVSQSRRPETSYWNADGLGFVKYCGWAPYRRPLTDPDFRNDTDCRDVMLQPQRDYIGACTLQECQGLEDCVARCDLCPNCSAVLYNSRETSGIRCHMQSNAYIESLESSALPVAWSFYVNERNVGCRPEAETDLLSTRGLRGFRLFADLGCSQELVPDQVFALDGGGLVPLQDVWVPRCASAGRCYAGGVSLMATFSSPQVVRCALVDAHEKFSRGWRLAKNSAEISGLLKDLAQAEWLEVARSGASLGVRASWDGLTEVDSSASGGSLASWGAADAGTNSSGGFLSILVALLAAGLCFVAGGFVYLRPLFRGPSQPVMLETRVPPVMFPPAAVLLEDEDALSPEHIDVSAATATTTEETCQLSFVSGEVFSHLQALLDFTHLSVPDRTAAGAAEPPVAVQLRHALRVKDSAKSRRYAHQCGAIRRKRSELKPISPELLSAAAAAKMDLQNVIPGPDPAANESYLWCQTSVRFALALAQGHGWEELARGGRSGSIRLTESCAQVEDVFPDRSGYYAGISALLLCRVCVGKFCYIADAGAEAKREVESGEFDSILEDNATRRILVFDDVQVLPEYLLLCSSIGHGEDTFLSALRLEMPIYWSNLSRDPISIVSGDLLTNESFLWLASDNEADGGGGIVVVAAASVAAALQGAITQSGRDEWRLECVYLAHLAFGVKSLFASGLLLNSVCDRIGPQVLKVFSKTC